MNRYLFSLVLCGAIWLVIVNRAVAVDFTCFYDLLNRLTKIEYANGSAVDYTHDPAGNLVTRSIESGVAQFQTLTVQADRANDCSLMGSGSFPAASQVTAVAMPASDYSLANWGGCLSPQVNATLSV